MRSAHVRTDIENETEAGQAASYSLPQLLCSLHQLVRFNPEDATSYLAFWYYVFKTELMALLRSGPGITLMVVTDDAKRFMSFAAQFANLADHFAMATTTEPTVVASSRTLNIPPRWRYPATFTFVGVRKASSKANDSGELPPEDENDAPPNIRLVGPARQIPPYLHVSVGGGGSLISAMDTPHLPAEALNLMLERPIKELIQRRALWFPSPRHTSDNPFLTDLRVAYERGLFPTYFDRLPTSNDVAVVGSVRVAVPESALTSSTSAFAAKWKRCLLKINRLSEAEANAALLDLPDSIPNADGDSQRMHLEVHLFEFTELGLKVIHPALLIR